MQNPRQDKPKHRPTPHIDKAHVDTMRLKRDMDADKRASFRLGDMMQEGTPNHRMDMGRAKSAVDERVKARGDSLQMARKKKSYASR